MMKVSINEEAEGGLREDDSQEKMEDMYSFERFKEVIRK